MNDIWQEVIAAKTMQDERGDFTYYKSSTPAVRKEMRRRMILGIAMMLRSIEEIDGDEQGN